MISVILHVNVSICAHCVMRDVIFGIIVIPAMLPMCCFYLIMVEQFSLQLLCLFGVSIIIICNHYKYNFGVVSCLVFGILEASTICTTA